MNLSTLLSLFFLLFSCKAFAGFHDLERMTLEATQQGKKLTTLLKEIELSPTGHMKSGRAIMKVSKVKEGSFYDQSGVVRGDLVVLGPRTTPHTNSQHDDDSKNLAVDYNE